MKKNSPYLIFSCKYCIVPDPLSITIDWETDLTPYWCSITLIFYIWNSWFSLFDFHTLNTKSIFGTYEVIINSIIFKWNISLQFVSRIPCFLWRISCTTLTIQFVSPWMMIMINNFAWFPFNSFDCIQFLAFCK